MEDRAPSSGSSAAHSTTAGSVPPSPASHLSHQCPEGAEQVSFIKTSKHTQRRGVALSDCSSKIQESCEDPTPGQTSGGAIQTSVRGSQGETELAESKEQDGGETRRLGSGVRSTVRDADRDSDTKAELNPVLRPVDTATDEEKKDAPWVAETENHPQPPLSQSGCSSSSTTFQCAETTLEELYEIHDRFFSVDKDEKQRRLKAKAAEVVEAVSRVGDVRDIQERARLSYIRGRALDVFSEFDEEAETHLARAVKLRPSDANSWIALGHCYWKKPNLPAAKRCFMQALDKDRTPDSLRQLSMLLRQLPGTAEETDAHLQESIRLAKEAVTLDMHCGESWYVMGNAYVASFFRSSRGFKDLDRALQAYSKAEANGAQDNPDLFFNRAQVLHYREDYADAVRNYRVAEELDPSLPVENALNAIETGVGRLANLVERKGGLKAKRMLQHIAPLKAVQATGTGLGKSFRIGCFGDLRSGINKGVAVAFKLAIPAGQFTPPPERLIVVDRQGDCAVLSLYSITKETCDKITTKDILVVKNPGFRTISLSLGEEGAGKSPPSSYPCIQADPAEMLINGQSMRGSFAAPAVLLANFDK